MENGEEREGELWDSASKIQDLRAAAAAAPFITEKRSETRNVDLANKIRRNDYLRQVDHRCTHIAIDRTGSLKYMSD